MLAAQHLPSTLNRSTIFGDRLFESCQFYRSVVTCHVVATNLSISSSCNQSVKIMHCTFKKIVICRLLQLVVKQLVARLWIKRFDSELATSLFTNCCRLVVNKLSQAMRTHPDIGSLITSLFQEFRAQLQVLTSSFQGNRWSSCEPAD